jgi:hypothetical protein
MNNSKLPKTTRLVIIGLTLIGLGIGSGCSQVPETVAIDPTPSFTKEIEPSTTVQLTSTPEVTPTEVSSPTPTPVLLERPQYQISASLDYPNHRVIVEERILISNPAGKPLKVIDLVVPPNNWGGVFTIQEVNAGDKVLESYSLDVVTLQLVLAEPAWQPDEILELNIQYSLNLPQQNSLPGYGPSPFGYTDLQTNLVDWYPMVPPYQEDEGWVIHDPWIFGEYLVYPAADFEVSLSTGAPGLVVASSTAPEVEGDPLKYKLTAARNFVFSISHSYEVLEEEQNGIKVFGYIFPAFQIPGKAAFEATLQALELYQDLYGPYPQSSLTMVQADFDHGMEYEGLYFLNRGFFNTYNGTEQSYLVTIAVHETAHQWWYGQVGNDQALEPWLDEAFCTFSELAFYENYYPQSVEWWWNTRVNIYQPSGRIDRSIYGFQEYTNQYLEYRNATYLQGAKFMAALKEHLGDETFFLFTKEYGEQNKDKIATQEQFFGLLGEYLDLSELDWLDEYFLIE